MKKWSENFVNKTFIDYLQIFSSLNTSSSRGADYQNHNSAVISALTECFSIEGDFMCAAHPNRPKTALPHCR